jgi:hypothetical protein
VQPPCFLANTDVNYVFSKSVKEGKWAIFIIIGIHFMQKDLTENLLYLPNQGISLEVV